MSQEAYPALPAVDIAELHEAIKTGLRDAFPTTGTGAVPTIDYYGRQGERIVTPAILFELTAIVPGNVGDDIGTEQFNATLEFSVYVMVSYRETAAKLAVRALVARTIAKLRGQRWGQRVTKADVQGGFPDQFINTAGGKSPNESYEMWRVDFTHDGLIDVSTWDPSGAVPTEVWTGLDPDTGIPNELRYRRVVPDADVTSTSRTGSGTAVEAGGGFTADAEVTIPPA